MKNTSQKQKKSISMYAVVLWIILLVYILSFIIPAGTYQRENGMTIPGSFEFLDKIYLTPIDVIMGLGNAILATYGSLIIVVLIFGGMMGVVNSTSAIDLSLTRLIARLKDKAFLLIPAIIFVMGFFGAMGSMISTAILFIPLGLKIAKQLKADRIFGVGLIVLGSYTGFMSSPVNIITTIMAQEIAGVPAYSGAGYRTIITVFNLALVAIYLTLYAKRISKTNKWETEFAESLETNAEHVIDVNEKLGWRKCCILIIFAGCFILFAIGAPIFNLGTLAFGSIMLPAGFLCGIIAQYDLDRTMKEFINGAKEMIGLIVLLMLTCAINVILNNAMIMDSIVYYLSLPLSQLGTTFSAIGIFLVTTIINCFIGSGSAKTALMIPILAPLSDIIGVTRQMAILAFQFGDGFTNLLAPINPTLLGGLAIAEKNFKDWYRLVLPLYFIQFFVLIAFTVIGVMIQF